MLLDGDRVRADLARLRQAGPAILGAESHRFLINEPLAEETVRTFERQHNVLLPAEYRHFITNIGNGGAGPFYGVFPLGTMDFLSDYVAWEEGVEMVGKLAEPFHHEGEWNDLGSKPADEDFDSTIEKFDEVYWNPSLMNGAIPICHTGCSLRIWMVVTGERTGHLWYDGRANYTGIIPLTNDDGSRLTFSRWYEDCLDLCLREAGIN